MPGGRRTAPKAHAHAHPPAHPLERFNSQEGACPLRMGSKLEASVRTHPTCEPGKHLPPLSSPKAGVGLWMCDCELTGTQAAGKLASRGGGGAADRPNRAP
eukprot:355616-Chlamydomonas_euryale.AAC.1